MKHIDLFSGIGGFSKAFDEVFYEQKNQHIFSDNNPFSQSVIRKHWPDSTIYGDIRSLTADAESERNRRLGLERKPNKEAAQAHDDYFLLTGGFPCQPFSVAGRRKGTADDRYLWPEMFRVIRDFKPTWVIAENVRGLITWNDGMVLEQVCSDLESEGYEVQPFIIPAVAVNAPHKRDRVWIIANAIDGESRREVGGIHEASDRIPKEHRKEDGTARKSFGADKQSDAYGYDADSCDSGLERRRKARKGHSRFSDRTRSYERSDWDKNWTEVAAELCSMDDGLPAIMGDIAITKSRHRIEQLKSYGNAIVPAVAIEIMKSIKSTIK